MSDPSATPSSGEPLGSPSPHEPAAPPPPGGIGGGISFSGFKEVFAIRDFRLLFWGQAISALGDWVGTLAFIVAAQRLAPDRPAAVAGILVIRLVPSFFATPIGGVLSDRWDRKKIMIWTDVARFAVIFAVPFVPMIGVLYAFAFLQECFSMLFLPARDASIPNLVPRRDLEAANALVMGSSFGGIPLSGPIFAGLAWVGAHYPAWLPFDAPIHRNSFAFAFFFDAFTFLGSAVAIGMMRMKHTPVPAAKAEPFMDALTDGVRYIRRRPFIRGLAFAVAVGMLGGGVLFAIGIGYIKETLQGGDVEFGWLMGLFGAGMVLGFLVSQTKPPGGIAWMLRTSLFTMGSVLGVMAVISQLWIGYVLAVLFGTSFSVSLIVAMSAAQSYTEDAVRGRVMAAVHMLVRGALSVGALASGALATLVPRGGVNLPLLPYRPDKNQIALLVSGILIAAGSTGVRAPDTEPPA